jgi:hypothetical protein
MHILYVKDTTMYVTGENHTCSHQYNRENKNLLEKEKEGGEGR